MFVTLTLANGQPLDIPATAVLFLEALDPEAQAANPGCRSGLFFDLGNGAQSALVQEPFRKLARRLEPARPGEFINLRGVYGGVLLLKANILSLRGLSDDHPNPGKCQISHRLPAPPSSVPGLVLEPRILPLDVLDTRDEIRAMLPADPMAIETEEQKDGDDDQGSDAPGE